MTHICCPACRLRFTGAAASGVGKCPSCDERLATASAAQVFGFRLFETVDRPAAVAVAVPVPGDRS